MIVAIHQPNYLPYLGFFHKMRRADVFVLYDTAQYSKNSYHNRNRVKTPRGPQWLTVPVRSPGRKAFRSVQIDSSRPWASRHTKTLQANYSNSAHFSEFSEDLLRTLNTPTTFLAELNCNLIRQLHSWLDLDAELVLASKVEMEPDLPPTERIVRLVDAFGGDTYLSGPGGRDYLDPRFVGDVRLVYDDFRHPTYLQLFPPFLPNMSIVDALFNCGSAEVHRFLSDQSV